MEEQSAMLQSAEAKGDVPKAAEIRYGTAEISGRAAL